MDFSFKNNNKPQKGMLLLSDPFELDEHFTRSVVLICNHDENGTFGFVLNNYVELSAAELNEELNSFDSRVSIGGPVEKTNLFYIHQFDDIAESEKIVENLYFGGDFNAIIDKINSNPQAKHTVRFFIGYSGWAGGQLEEELTHNAWIVINNQSIEQIMDTSSDNLWKEIMQRQGSKFKLLADFPLNPENN